MNRRIEINEEYWDMIDPREQKSFIMGCMKKNEVKRKTVVGDSRRSGTNHYFFKNDEGHSVRVCKTLPDNSWVRQ